MQDVILHTDNVLFHKEKFYSPSQQKSYLAALPQGYSCQFGPGIKASVLVFYFGAQMSEPKVAELLRNVGVKISDGQVSNLLIKEQKGFHQEKDALYQAGLSSSRWQHLDETSTRVNGQCYNFQDRVQSALHRLLHHRMQRPPHSHRRAEEQAAEALFGQ